MIIMASIREKLELADVPKGISGTADIIHNNRLDCAGFHGLSLA